MEGDEMTSEMYPRRDEAVPETMAFGERVSIPGPPPESVRAEDLASEIEARLDDSAVHDAIHEEDRARGVRANDRDHSRRTFLLVAGAAFGGAAGLAACGGGGKTASGASTTAAATSVAGLPAPSIPKSEQVYYWVADGNNPFFTPGKAAMSLFGEVFGVKTEFVAPSVTSNVAQIAANFQTVIEKPGTAGIVSYFAESAPAASSANEQAFAKGIPVVNAAGPWAAPSVSLSTVWWAEDDVPEAAAAQIASALGGKGTVGAMGNLNAAEVNAEVALLPQILRTKYPGLQFVGKQSYDGSANDALAKYGAFVNAHTPDAMWFADGLGPSLVSGLTTASEHHPKLMLRGYGSTAFEAVKAGHAIGTADRNTFEEEFWAFLPLWVAANLQVDGPEQINLAIHSVTPANVDAYLKSPNYSLKHWV
jgi:ABC-type sugar transport system substrate-binding protein